MGVQERQHNGLCWLNLPLPSTSHVNGCWWWSISSKVFPSSFCAPTKLDPLSPSRTLMFPLLAINHHRACMNESVSMLHVHSVCTALLAKHMKSAPYLLSSFLPSFIRNGPNISTPQLVNSGQSNVLSFGSFAIFCLPSFPLSNRHSTHFPIRLLRLVLHQTTQNHSFWFHLL